MVKRKNGFKIINFLFWIPDPRPAPLAGQAFNIYSLRGKVCRE